MVMNKEGSLVPLTPALFLVVHGVPHRHVVCMVVSTILQGRIFMDKQNKETQFEVSHVLYAISCLSGLILPTYYFSEFSLLSIIACLVP